MSSLIIKIVAPVSIIGGGIYAYKKFDFNVPKFDVPLKLNDRVIIVTGPTKGIGRATVEALATSGARIVMAAKDIEECKNVRREIVINSKNRHVVCRHCDLSSFESIKRFAARMIKEEPQIDVLINNAGVKYVRPKRFTKENIELQLGVNFLGPFLLTQLLRDKLLESTGARVVNVIGNAYTKGTINMEDLNGEINYHPATSYDQSKLALALVTKELAKQFDPSKVTVNGVDPGYSNTNIERYTQKFARALRSMFNYVVCREARQGAYPPLYAALNLELDGTTGRYINCNLEVEDFDEKVTNDPILQRKVFLIGQKWGRVDEARLDVEKIVASLPEPKKEKPKTTSSKPSLSTPPVNRALTESVRLPNV